jgi:hypothetical protein
VDEDVVDDLRCEVVSVAYYNVVGEKAELSSESHFWLAVDRNYLPVRLESSSHPWEGRTAELFELAPDVWLPRRFVLTSHSIKDSRRTVEFVREYEVLRCVLNPQLPDPFFQGEAIPFDAYVHEIHDGETVRGYYNSQRFPADTKYLDLSPPITDERLVTSLHGLRNLEQLSVYESAITERGLTALRETPDLQFLNLTKCTLSDDALTGLQFVPHVQSLDLSGTNVSDNGLAHLSHLPTLRYVQLRDCERLTGTGLNALGNDVPLTSLQLDGCPNVSDAAMREVGRFRSLTFLTLNGTGVGDDGLEALSQVKVLGLLSLQDCRAITDEGLVHLQGLEHLENLILRGCTGVTDAGVSRLKEALPKCHVSR